MILADCRLSSECLYFGRVQLVSSILLGRLCKIAHPIMLSHPSRHDVANCQNRQQPYDLLTRFTQSDVHAGCTVKPRVERLTCGRKTIFIARP
jgi:hypothetical protein